jgi:hypothetical protein
MNTNSKEFMKKVQSFIVNDWEWTPERIKSQFEVFNWMPNTYQKAKYLIEGGAFDCYYSQVADSMAEFFNTTADRIWAYYHENGSKMWDSYVHIMAKNLVCLAENKRNYLNK